MKHVAAVAAGSSPFVTFGALQLLGSSQVAAWPAVADDFMSLRFWLILAVVLIAGAFGGISYELLLRKGAIEMPHRVKSKRGVRKYSHAPAETLIALGIVGRAIVGASAAAAAMLVVAPSTGQGAIALGVTAGAAAPAMIRLMRKQLLFAADAMSRLSTPERRATAEPAAPRAAIVSRAA
jgi:hypothetical protein